MVTDEERKVFELRVNIESDMYELVGLGFSLEDLTDFVTGVLDNIREDQLDEQDGS